MSEYCNVDDKLTKKINPTSGIVGSDFLSKNLLKFYELIFSLNCDMMCL